MAEVFRPIYYVDRATGKRVNAGFFGAVRKKSPTWHIRYYTPGGKRNRVKGYRDRKATETLANELEKRAERLASGMTDPTEIHARKLLAEHVKDFRRYLAAKGNTEEYVAKMIFRLNTVLDGCRFVKIGEIQSSAVVESLAALRGDGKSVKTANDYLAAAKGFTRWLWRDKRVAVDPLAGLSKLANGETDIRHARRDFSPDELGRLLEVARQSTKSIRCLSGIDRHFLYLTACSTGFRAAELASMSPESFELDGDTPTAKVQATCTKNRRLAIQPLPLEVAKALRDYLRDKTAGKPVWPGKWKSRAFLMVREDLANAREQWISEAQEDPERARRKQSDFLAYEDAEGRYADFHALRHSYITMVGKAGVSAKEHQDLARHSTYTLTARYSHSRFYDLAAAVQGLPIGTHATDREKEKLSATGTDGKVGKIRGPFLGPRPANSGEFQRQTETGDRGLSQQQNPGKQAVCAVFQGSQRMGYKVEPRGIEPLTQSPQSITNKPVAGTDPERLAHSLSHETEKLSFPAPETDPVLAKIVAAWATLPKPIKKAILALVEN